MEAIIYLSSKQPNVIKLISEEQQSIKQIENSETKYEYIIPLTKIQKDAKYTCIINCIPELYHYNSYIWDKSTDNISWERTTHTITYPPIEQDEQGNPISNTETFYYPSITISYFNPSQAYTPNPYWLSTYIDAYNPTKLIAHIPPILISSYNDELHNDLTFNELLSSYLEELKQVNINQLYVQLSEYNKLNNVLIKILNNINKIAGDIPDTSSNSILQQLKTLLDNIKEQFPKQMVLNTVQKLNTLITAINTSLNKNMYWIKAVPEGLIEHIESTPIVLPGEYIRLSWDMESDGQQFSQVIRNVKFETPLFTGGQIIAKHDEGINTLYDVKIYDKVYYNVMPTDFFDYQIGKWCYLLKDSKLEGEHQSYGSSDIESNKTIDNSITVINTIRKQYNLNELIVNKFLENSSEQHSKDISENNIISNTGSDGSTYEQRIQESGYTDNLTGDSGITELVGYLPKDEIPYKITYDNSSKTTTTEYDYDAGVEVVINKWLSDNSEILLNPDIQEIGINVQYNDNGDMYVVADMGYRTDGINVGLKSVYKITPFNFGGRMTSDMAISYINDLQIDFATNFEKVFDMKTYTGNIVSVDKTTDKATVNILMNPNYIENNITPIIKQFTLPVFYHCSNVESTQGGSSAFNVFDNVLIYTYNDTFDEKSHIIGFPTQLKKCAKGLTIEVLNANNDVIVGALVHIINTTDTGINEFNAYTDMQGMVEILEIEVGNIVISIASDGYMPLNDMFEFTETTEKTYTLQAPEGILPVFGAFDSTNYDIFDIIEFGYYANIYAMFDSNDIASCKSQFPHPYSYGCIKNINQINLQNCIISKAIYLNSTATVISGNKDLIYGLDFSIYCPITDAFSVKGGHAVYYELPISVKDDGIEIVRVPRTLRANLIAGQQLLQSYEIKGYTPANKVVTILSYLLDGEGQPTSYVKEERTVYNSEGYEALSHYYENGIFSIPNLVNLPLQVRTEYYYKIQYNSVITKTYDWDITGENTFLQHYDEVQTGTFIETYRFVDTQGQVIGEWTNNATSYHLFYNQRQREDYSLEKYNQIIISDRETASFDLENLYVYNDMIGVYGYIDTYDSNTQGYYKFIPLYPAMPNMLNGCIGGECIYNDGFIFE